MISAHAQGVMKSRLSYAFLVLVLFTFFMASSVPTPLYQVYQREWKFNALTLTVIFSIYAIGMLISLLVVGSLSDFLGRKPVIASAIVLESLSMVLFIQADSASNLILARVIQGGATGIAATAVGAFLLDINHEKAVVSNSVVPLIGVGLGAIASSAILDFGMFPLSFIYILV